MGAAVGVDAVIIAYLAGDDAQVARASEDAEWEEARREWGSEPKTREISALLLRQLQWLSALGTK